MICNSSSKTRIGLTATLMAAGIAATLVVAQDAKPDQALERTRKTVRMLDDIYKAAVILITDKYVNKEDDFPAGSAAIALFDAVKQKKWHEVKLLDVSGKPYDDKNVPKDDFEKTAATELKSGKDYLDRVEMRDDGRYLRAQRPSLWSCPSASCATRTTSKPRRPSRSACCPIH